MTELRPCELWSEAYQFTKERFKDEEQFKQIMDGWSLFGIFRNKRCIGVVFSKDGFIHISIDHPFRKIWATKGLIRLILKTLAVDGKCSTTVFDGDKFRSDFAERLGFASQNNVDGIKLYEASVNA